MALDFAVTSGMRDIAASTQDASSATIAYEDYKKSYLDTERQCVQEGFSFTPMVVEAVGGAWGPAANKIFFHLAKEKSMFTGENEKKLLLELHQLLGIILHRENARAVLRRLRGRSFDTQGILTAAATLQAAAAEAPP